MSYTSKYTGPEIDSLLDKIGLNGAGQITNIFNERTETLNLDYTLNGNISDYDMLLVQASIPKNGSLITALPIINPQINKSYAMGNYHGNDNDAAYFLTFAFTSKTTVKQLDRLGKGDEYWQNVSIDAIYGIKLATGAANAGSNPIGAIIPIIGTQAPKDHLVCDGSVLNISEYEELADYFEKQFGSKNHFGGDGIDTFAIPDLRNEFLRGYGDRTEEIGMHQEGTSIPHFTTTAVDWQTWIRVPAAVANGDVGVGEDKQTGYVQIGPTHTQASTGNPSGWTVRPTNVSVLFCIKYTENSTTNTNVAFSQTNIMFTNGQERIVSKQGRLVTFSLNSNKGFTNIVADRWVKIGEVPEEYKPAEPAGFALATYSPNTTGYGKVDSADGSIYVYFNSTLNDNTQLFANVTYSV